MADRVLQMFQNQYKEAIKADHPNLIPLIDDSNIRKWHFLVTNLPAPFTGGEYIFQLLATDGYPHDPPKFTFLTNNGMFETHGPICISIGEFHAHDAPGNDGSFSWRAVLGLMGFARQVAGAMSDTDPLGEGIRLTNASANIKRCLAKASPISNRQNYPDLMAKVDEFEKIHPNHQAVKLRKMQRATTQALQIDFKTVELESLPPLLANALGENWDIISNCIQYLAGIPDIPVEQLVSMDFPVNGRTILNRVITPLCNMLNEYDLSVRKVLVLALNVRICWEIARGENVDPEQAKAMMPQVVEMWRQSFVEGFKAFIVELPNVCGGASNVLVPDAMRPVLNYPDTFSKVHEDLITFLCTRNIDEKARLGDALATQLRSRIMEISDYTSSVDIEAKSGEESVISECATQSDDLLEDYSVEFLDGSMHCLFNS